VVLLPDGWGGKFEIPDSWADAGKTWSYGTLGGAPPVFAFIACVVLTFILAVWPVALKPIKKD